jgi:hypothetical protein
MYIVHRGLINNKYLPRSVKHDPDLNRQKAKMWPSKKKGISKIQDFRNCMLSLEDCRLLRSLEDLREGLGRKEIL